MIFVPKNDVSALDLRGSVAVLSEKHKPGTMSDGALLQQAYDAGAEAVIKIGGGGGPVGFGSYREALFDVSQKTKTIWTT